MITGFPAVLQDVPVDPDAETARRWLEAELSEPAYNQRESLLVQVLRWIYEQLMEMQVTASGVDPRLGAVVLGGLVLAAVAVALLVTGPVRRARRARESVAVLGEDGRTAAELRASADELASRGRWSEAVLDRFRAVLRSLEERALLDERPGRTAHEAVLEAATLFPGETAALRRGGDLFDDVCYGEVEASAADDAHLRDLDAHLVAARPDRANRAVDRAGDRAGDGAAVPADHADSADQRVEAS